MISLYAHGAASIEVGRYRTSLEDALTRFVETAEAKGLTVKGIERKHKENQIQVQFNWDCAKQADLLYEIAHVSDLHADAPDSYSLELVAEDGPFYEKTGYYND